MSIEFVQSRWEDSELERFEGFPSEEPHLHERLEVGFVDQGALALEGPKWRQLVEPGSAYLLGVGLVHRLAERSPGLRLHRMYLGKRASSALVAEDLVETASRQPVLLPRAVAESWWSEMARGWYPARPEPAAPARALNHPAVARAIAHLRSNLNRTVSLDELGKTCRISKFHLCRVFHRVVGVTPRTYHRHVRLEASRRLLQRGRPSALVAHDLSFSDQSHFIRSYRKQFGMTPGDYVQALAVQVAAAPRSAAYG